jgi:cytochrome P450
MKAACETWLTSFGTQEIPFTFISAFSAPQNTVGKYEGLNCITNSEQIYIQVSRVTGSGSPYNFSFVLVNDASTATYSFKDAEFGQCNDKATEAFTQVFASQFAAMSAEFREDVRDSVTKSFCPTQVEILKAKISEIVQAKQK